MNKVLHIITKSEVGGAQTWVSEQVETLKGSFCFYLVTNEKGWLSDRGFEDELYLPSIERKFSLSCLFRILSFVRKNGVDTIVASSANAGIYARLLSFFTNCKIIYVSHGWSCIYNGGRLKHLFIAIEWALSFLTDVILCVSKNDYKSATEIIKIRPYKLRVIRSSIIPRKKVPESLTKEDGLKVLFLGRLAPPKRPDLLIEAVSEIKGVRLDIVGEGPLSDSLDRNVHGVRYLGNIPNFNSFSDYDLFALISDSEGLPMSALEAGSAGVPMLLSNVGGCGELIFGNGEVVDNNLSSIKQGIESIMYSYSSYKSRALNVRESFDLNKSKDCYIDLYTK